MKKDIFNFNRFGKYFVSDMRTCMANYGLSLISLSILALLVLYVIYVGFSLMLGAGWNGPAMPFRLTVFGVVMFCIVVTMPVKCYGKITERQYGSHWLMLPASRLEKFFSMLILSCVVVPFVGFVLYLGVDALVCAIDHTCGDSLIRTIIELEAMINEGILEVKADLGNFEYEGFANFISQMSNPWLYVDDMFGMTLPFLLGALMFKNGKTVKTFLALIAFGIFTSVISTPMIYGWGSSVVESLGMMETADPRKAMELLYDNWMFRNIALVDTITDTVVNLAILVGIFFRIKTLKH